MRFAVADGDGAAFVHENAAGVCEFAVARFVVIGAVVLFAVLDENFDGGHFDTKIAERV
jgi:hypothetical protein